jgi:hypothetical protein
MALLNKDNLLFLDADTIVPRPLSYTRDIHDFSNADYWYCEFFNEYSIKHFLNPNVISNEVLDKVRNHECIIMMNNAHEAFHTVIRPIYDILIKQLNIPPKQIILITESATIEDEVTAISNEYNLDRIKTEWIRVFEFAIKDHPQKNTNTLEYKPYPKKFLSLNRRWRIHRPTLVSLLKINNLLDLGYVSLVKNVDNADWEDYFGSISWVSRNNPDFLNVLLKHKDVIVNLPDLYLDQYDMNINHNGITESTDVYYENTYFSVVSETNFFKEFGEGIFISEKIFKPIIKKHPFIVVARPNTLTVLRSLGYKTFSPYIDESYDVETDDYKRMLLIVEEIKRLSNFNESQLYEFLTVCKEIVEYNYNVLINKNNYLIKNYVE